MMLIHEGYSGGRMGTSDRDQNLDFCNQFMSQIRTRFPLPPEVQLTTVYHADKERLDWYGGRTAFATCTNDKKAKTARIDVASKGVSTYHLMISTAHEYKHAHQAFVEGKTPTGRWDLALEADAEGFGFHETRAYMRSLGIEPPPPIPSK